MTRAHNDDTQRMSNLHLKAMNEEAEQGKHTQRHMARNKKDKKKISENLYVTAYLNSQFITV